MVLACAWPLRLHSLGLPFLMCRILSHFVSFTSGGDGLLTAKRPGESGFLAGALLRGWRGSSGDTVAVGGAMSLGAFVA